VWSYNIFIDGKQTTKEGLQRRQNSTAKTEGDEVKASERDRNRIGLHQRERDIRSFKVGNNGGMNPHVNRESAGTRETHLSNVAGFRESKHDIDESDEGSQPYLHL